MRKLNNIFLLLLMLVTSGIFSSCDHHTALLHQFRTVDIKGWDAHDTLTFNLPIDTVPLLLNCQIQMRHKAFYPYEDLYLALHQNFRDSMQFETDTFHVHLTNKEGKWLGSGYGHLFQLAIFVKSYSITNRGNYTIQLNHLMTDSILKGIQDVGIKLEKRTH